MSSRCTCSLLGKIIFFIFTTSLCAGLTQNPPLKQTPLVWGHHLVVAHSLAFSFNIPKIENFTKLLTQLFHTFAFAILPSLETIWQVGIVFRSPAIYLGRSLIIREYNGKFSDRITIQTSSLRTSSRRRRRRPGSSQKRTSGCIAVSDEFCRISRCSSKPPTSPK